MPSRPRPLVLVCLGVVAYAGPATATFHLMQIQQVVGGVCGDPSRQAIQLRTRTTGQNFVAGTMLVVRDAAGANPITLLTYPSHVANGGTGVTILATTSGLASAYGVTPDFTLAQPIPESYLAAGRLTFEDLGGDGTIRVYWSLA